MMTTKTYKLYSTVVVPFPFTDSTDFKKRPALVISTEAQQAVTSHVTLMMITSAKHSKWETDHFITDIKTAGLPTNSYIRCKIFTLDLRLIINSIGQLGADDQQAIRTLLKNHFNF